MNRRLIWLTTHALAFGLFATLSQWFDNIVWSM